MRVLKTTAAFLFLVAVSFRRSNYRVHSQASMRAADQANVAAIGNATWVPALLISRVCPQTTDHLHLQNRRQSTRCRWSTC